MCKYLMISNIVLIACISLILPGVIAAEERTNINTPLIDPGHINTPLIGPGRIGAPPPHHNENIRTSADIMICAVARCEIRLPIQFSCGN